MTKNKNAFKNHLTYKWLKYMQISLHNDRSNLKKKTTGTIRQSAEQSLQACRVNGSYCVLYLLKDSGVHIRKWNWVIISLIVHSQICQTIQVISLCIYNPQADTKRQRFTDTGGLSMGRLKKQYLPTWFWWWPTVWLSQHPLRRFPHQSSVVL